MIKSILKSKLFVWFSAFIAALCFMLGVTSLQKTKGLAEASSEEVTLEIVSNNVSNDDATYILYAVANSGFDKTQNEITMLFWTELQDTYVKGTEAYVSTTKGSITLEEQSCEVFYSEGLPAKKMADDLYCRAYVQIDGQDYYSDVLKYSVLEYVHERKESGDALDKQVKLYDAMLEYGAAAQDLFAYNLDRLANDTYYKVAVTDGYCEDGFALGRYKTGDTVTVYANEAPEGKIFSHWKNDMGTKVSESAEYVVEVGTANCILTAVYKENSAASTPTIEELVDFVVEVEEGRDPVVLQLSDPQFSDYGTPNSYCYDYLQETIEETQPDLILVTGDIVYGKFDEDGQFLLDYIEFMESFQIPWAPIFGNHENECILGVDWQCQQLEEAEYCLFKQGDLTGNGNYSVGLLQGNELLRVFYMLDSNGCSDPSDASVSSANGIKTTAGFGQDQIDWYTQSITTLKTLVPDVKVSFAYHIQQAVFEDAIEKYNEDLNTSSSSILLNIDALETADETDFGCIGKKTEKLWDADYSVWNGMKALGVDSVFVGHQHSNSFSIVYEGVRLQFGQKSSMYDSFNWVLPDGTIQSGSMETKPDEGNSLVGGTVIPVSAEDGSIGTGYIYYAGDPFTFTGSADVLQGDARTRMPVYSGDAATLGFAEGTTVYVLENTLEGDVWTDDAWTTRAILCASGTQDYITIEFVSENDITNSPFNLWGVKGTPNIGAVGFTATDNGLITDMNGYPVTSIKAGQHYLLNMACAGLSEIQVGLRAGINTVYFANITFNNGELPGPKDLIQQGNTTLPTYSGDVTALGFEEDTLVQYMTTETVTDSWGTEPTSGKTREELAAYILGETGKYVTIKFAVSEDVSGTYVFYVWGLLGSSHTKNGYVDFNRTTYGRIMDEKGTLVTSLTKNTVYVLELYIEGTDTYKIANMCKTGMELYFATASVTCADKSIAPVPVFQGANRNEMPTYEGEATDLGFAEGTTVYALENTQEGKWTDDTSDKKVIICPPGTQDYVVLEFVSEIDIPNETVRGPFYIWGAGGSPSIGYVKLTTTDIGLITDMDGNAVTSIVAGQHYLLYIACADMSEIQIGPVYGINTIYFANVTYENGTFAAN